MKELAQQEDSKLSMPEISVLRTLVMEGEMSLIDVAQKTGKDKSQITRIVQDLGRKRIVRKERSEVDRRRFILKLNAGVEKKISPYLKKEQEIITKMLCGFTEDEQCIISKLIIKMNDNLKEDNKSSL